MGTKRMSAVEAATARLEAAKKKERSGLLRRARKLLAEARVYLEAEVVGAKIYGNREGYVVINSDELLDAIIVRIDEEVGE